MTGERLTLLAHAAATWYMVGLIWFVQVVHYPLFDRAERADFARFSQDHQRLTTWVVGPPMLAEMLTALALVVARPAAVPGWQAGLGLGLVLLIWTSTAPRAGAPACRPDARLRPRGAPVPRRQQLAAYPGLEHARSTRAVVAAVMAGGRLSGCGMAWAGVNQPVRQKIGSRGRTEPVAVAILAVGVVRSLNYGFIPHLRHRACHYADQRTDRTRDGTRLGFDPGAVGTTARTAR
jgi:hypothetical protein